MILEEKEEKKLSNKNKKADENAKKPNIEAKTVTPKAKKVSNEDPAVQAILDEGEEKKKDPIPETPLQKLNPNYCTYKVKADGSPHPDACKCIYVQNTEGKCVTLTNDCMPLDTPPASC